MNQKEFFSDVKGKGPMVNKASDYEYYVCRVGLKTGQTIDSETVRKISFKGEHARQRAEAWVDQQRTELEKEPEKQPVKATRKGHKP